MNIKQKIILTMGILTTIIGLNSVVTQPAFAACGKVGDNEVKTSIINCDADNSSSDTKRNAIWQVLIWALQLMTAGVGVLAVGGITYGAILYASASDKAEQTKKGISIISNTVIGLVAYGLMYLVLNFLIPGGIFT